MSVSNIKIFGKPILCTIILASLLLIPFIKNYEIIVYILIALLWIDAIILLLKNHFGVNKVTCPNCGESVENKKFCEKCGFAFLKSCPNCHTSLKGAPENCPECGYDLVKKQKADKKEEIKIDTSETSHQLTRFCPGCGSKITGKNAKFCPDCGTKID